MMTTDQAAEYMLLAAKLGIRAVKENWPEIISNLEIEKKGRTEMANTNGSKWIRPEKRLALYIRDGFSCAYCGRSLKNAAPEEVTLDHLLPRVAGGGNEATNLITACRSCNSSRQDTPWLTYATGGARDRIEQLRHAEVNVKLAKAIIEDRAGDAEVEALR